MPTTACLDTPPSGTHRGMTTLLQGLTVSGRIISDDSRMSLVAGRGDGPEIGVMPSGDPGGEVNRQAGPARDGDHLPATKLSPSEPLTVTVPLRTGPGMNIREHHFERARRVKRERTTTAWALATQAKRTVIPLPCRVTLTRSGPSQGLDSDNLQGSLKGVRDAVAAYLGADDADPRIEWAYTQRRTRTWEVRIHIEPLGA